MDINIKTVEQTVVVELDGKIDSQTAPQVQAQISPLLQPGSSIVLDMTRVTYMSSAGLRLLVAVHRQLVDSDGTLVLAGLAGRVRDTMSITGFLPYFTTYDSVEAALTALQ
jgi:anti-sigma B factor antagonist